MHKKINPDELEGSLEELKTVENLNLYYMTAEQSLETIHSMCYKLDFIVEITRENECISRLTLKQLLN
jgi:hypothetical protein